MKDLDDRWLDLQKGGLPERLASPTNSVRAALAAEEHAVARPQSRP